MYDELTGLYYLNARYYNPESATFTTQDSYRGEQNDYGTWNLYAYCGGNPVNYVDPSGHKCKHPNSGAGTAVYFVPCSICGYEPPSNEEIYRILLESTKKISMSDLSGINAEEYKKKFVVKIYNKALKYEAKYDIPAAIITA